VVLKLQAREAESNVFDRILHETATLILLMIPRAGFMPVALTVSSRVAESISLNLLKGKGSSDFDTDQCLPSMKGRKWRL